MRKIPANLARVLLFAITLFVVGPLFGSLDIDGDGVPDVPVVVMHRGNDYNVQRRHSDGQTNVPVATAWPFAGRIGNGLFFREGRIVVTPYLSTPDTVLPLRC